MSTLWRAYKTRIHRNCVRHFHPSDGINYWRDRLFASIMIYLLPMGIAMNLPAIIVAYLVGQLWLSFYYSAFMVIIICIGLIPAIPVFMRKVLFLIFIYTVGSVLLFELSIYGPGLMYLFGVTIFALLILSRRAGVWTIAIHSALFIVYAVLIQLGIAEYVFRDEFEAFSWLAIAANCILLSGIAVTYLPMLFDGLLNTIDKQQELEDQLRDKQRELEESLEQITDKNREIRQSERMIRNSLKEKETLLAEIHHRVKNNLALISSMLQLQSFQEEDQNLNRKLLDSTMRIKSIANIHEQLYQANSFSEMDFGSSLKRLITTIQNTVQSSPADLEFSYRLDSVRLNVKQAIPCSLIVNEVITNIMKHAYPSRQEGLVVIELHNTNGEIALTIQDNGIGMPADFDPEETASLGFQLIRTLSSQINADYRYHSNGEGTRFELTFNTNNISEAAVSRN